MLRGLWGLTWLEIKIFVREPLGVFGSVFVPVLLFVVVGRAVGPRLGRLPAAVPPFLAADLPVFAAVLITTSTVLSLVTILAIYREGGILKRLRATPLRPPAILAAHVLVKLLFTALTLALMVLAGRRYYPVGADVPLLSFTLALLLGTVSTCAFGFLIASLVPTARFAQPIGALAFYPMLAVSGLFAPLAAMPAPVRGVARMLPLTYAVSLMKGIWHGDGWVLHMGDAAVLVVMLLAFTALSSRVFRWE
jgi:ABC-2 type transport system permease protein